MAISSRINRNSNRDLAVIGIAALHARMAWIAAEFECERALRAWFDTGAPRGAGEYLAYSSALDREEAAARVLKRMCELTQPDPEQLARTR